MKNRKKVHFVPVIGFEPIIVLLLKQLRMPIPPYRYLCGKSEIRTHGPLTVGSLVNCWFKPLTHLSDWVKGRYRTDLSGSTNRRITLMLLRPYVESNHFPNSYVRRYSFILYRGVYWIRTNVRGFADLHLATRTTHLIVVSVGLEPTL